MAALHDLKHGPLGTLTQRLDTDAKGLGCLALT